MFAAFTRLIIAVGAVSGNGLLVLAQESPHPGATARTEHVDPEGHRIVQVIDGDRMIRISERTLGITVTVVETERGVDKSDRYFARSAEQLKKKEPEAYALYERYWEAEMSPLPPTDDGEFELQRRMNGMLEARILELQRQYANNQQMLQVLSALQRQSAGGPAGPFYGNQTQTQRGAEAAARATAWARAEASARSQANASGNARASAAAGAQLRGPARPAPGGVSPGDVLK